jgi:hypothetical protein
MTGHAREFGQIIASLKATIAALRRKGGPRPMALPPGGGLIYDATPNGRPNQMTLLMTAVTSMVQPGAGAAWMVRWPNVPLAVELGAELLSALDQLHRAEKWFRGGRHAKGVVGWQTMPATAQAADWMTSFLGRVVLPAIDDAMRFDQAAGAVPLGALPRLSVLCAIARPFTTDPAVAAWVATWPAEGAPLAVGGLGGFKAAVAALASIGDGSAAVPAAAGFADWLCSIMTGLVLPAMGQAFLRDQARGWVDRGKASLTSTGSVIAGKPHAA